MPVAHGLGFWTRSLTRDVVRPGGTSGRSGVIKAAWSGGLERIGTHRHAWDVALSAHNPEVAGSNPAPATNVVAGQWPQTDRLGGIVTAHDGHPFDADIRSYLGGL
jgi:hypothetical protein